MATDTYNADNSWTAPPGVTQALVKAWAGGAGGGGGGAAGGGGGAGGGYAATLVPVTPADTYSLYVGAGGAGGAASNDGTAGGNTYFDDGALILANGGTGGTTAGAGGAIGIGNVGTTTVNGGAGGTKGTTGGGAGGGSAGTGAGGAGGNGSTVTGGTAGAAGAGGGAAGGAGGNATVAGAAGAAPGAGGGGGGNTAAGGAGAAGRITITYFPTPINTTPGFSGFGTEIDGVAFESTYLPHSTYIDVMDAPDVSGMAVVVDAIDLKCTGAAITLTFCAGGAATGTIFSVLLADGDRWVSPAGFRMPLTANNALALRGLATSARLRGGICWHLEPVSRA